MISLVCIQRQPAETMIKASEENAQPSISMQKFIKRSLAHDPSFPYILIEELRLQLYKGLNLEPSDLVLNLTAQYSMILDEQGQSGDPVPEASISLQKLFATSATNLSASYSLSRLNTSTSGYQRSQFLLILSQDIARNAFGKAYRLLEKKNDLLVAWLRHQVIEAYEDYLASMILLYIDWFLAQENMILAESNVIYQKNLLSLMQQKQRYRIAYNKDVQKVRLELAKAEEAQALARHNHKQVEFKISQLLKLDATKMPRPQPPVIADRALQKKAVETRTFQMLKLMVDQGINDTLIAKNNLLPSASLFAGYSIVGREWEFIDKEHKIYAGLTSALNFTKHREKALYESARIDARKHTLQKQRDLLYLDNLLFEIRSRIDKEQLLIQNAQAQLVMAERILQEEQRHFLIGKATLNDLIMARNQKENINYSLLLHKILLQKWILEFQRLSDTLVAENKKINLSGF